MYNVHIITWQVGFIEIGTQSHAAPVSGYNIMF